MTRTQTLVAVCAILFSSAAFAHGKDGVHLKGTVNAFTNESLTVIGAENKKESVVHIDDNTKFDRAGTGTDRRDLTVGEKVVVHAKKMKDGSLHGHTVKLGKKADAAEPKPKTDAQQTKKDGAEDHSKH